MSQLLPKAEFLTLDIETLEIPPTQEELDELKTRFIRTREAIIDELCGKYKKEETVLAHIPEEAAKDEAKLQAELDRRKFTRQGARVLCIGMMLFSAETGERLDSVCEPDANEELMLLRTFQQMEQMIKAHDLPYYPPIYTFNGDAFDLPHVAAACARHKVYPSHPLNLRGCIDLMRRPLEDRANGSVNLETLYGIYDGAPVPEELRVSDYPDADGSKVAEMWGKDLQDGAGRVRRYCLADCWMTGQIAFKLQRMFLM